MKRLEEEFLKENLRVVPNFPKEGINFYDITTLLKNRECYDLIVRSIVDYYIGKKITKVVGLDSRGFIVAGALSYQLDAGFVPVRKPNKLPWKSKSVNYEKEYGQDSLSIHEDAIESDDIVLIHDDLLATGGTMKAALGLVQSFHPKKSYINTIISLPICKETFEVEVTSLLDM